MIWGSSIWEEKPAGDWVTEGARGEDELELSFKERGASSPVGKCCCHCTRRFARLYTIKKWNKEVLKRHHQGGASGRPKR